jgi:hypothetical protein
MYGNTTMKPFVQLIYTNKKEKNPEHLVTNSVITVAAITHFFE